MLIYASIASLFLLLSPYPYTDGEAVRSDTTDHAEDEPANRARVVIVAGHVGSPSGDQTPDVARGALSFDRHWVILGNVSDGGDLTPLTPSGCDTSRVAFTLGVSEKPGTSPPSDTVRGVVVPWEVLSSERWGAPDSMKADIAPAVVVDAATDDEDSYCVAYAAPRLADTSAVQVVTARVVRPAKGGEATAAEVAYASEGRPGGTFEFGGRRVDRASGRLVIVARSVGQRYAYAGTLMPTGTYAVALGAWDPEAERVRPPTVAECRGAKVAFTLRVPAKAGLDAPRAEVGATWVDAGDAKALFDSTLTRYGADTTAWGSHSRCMTDDAIEDGGACDKNGVEWAASTWAALDGIREEDYPLDLGEVGNAPFYCVAEAPLMLSTSVGNQQVLADVVPTGASPDLSVVEALRQPAGSLPGSRAQFRSIRAHAPPRPMFGVIRAIYGGVISKEAETRTVTTTVVETTTIGDTITSAETTTETREIRQEGFIPAEMAFMAGVDFALQPVVGVGCQIYHWVTKGRRRCEPVFPGPTRMVVATNVTGDPLDSIYLGLSLASLAGTSATSSPVDGTLGVAYRRSEDTGDKSEFMVAGAITIDLGGALAVLKDIITL